MFSINGTIAHEMEHFRRQTAHDRSVHGPMKVDLPVGGKKLRHYAQCHIDTMKSILKKGFYSQVKTKEYL